MDAEKHICPNCKGEYAHSSSLCRHMRTCGQHQSFPCRGCSKTFDRKDTLHRHLKTCKGDDQVWKCDKCAKTFPYQAYLKRHRCSKCPTRGMKISNNSNHVCQGLLVKLPERKRRVIKKRKREHEDGWASSGACADAGAAGDAGCDEDPFILDDNLLNDVIMIHYAPTLLPLQWWTLDGQRFSGVY